MSRAPHAGGVVVLAGGTGGAKLARGLLDVLPAGELTVVANTGDDIDIYGAHVSPDPDLVAFWLADRIDERGWGLREDTFCVMDGLRELGVEVWFNLGDRDLAWCLERRRLLDIGMTPTAAGARLLAKLDVPARVLPMADHPVRTWVRSSEHWRSFQEFMIRLGGVGPVQGLQFRGAEQTRPTRAVLEALATARAIVIGPSNPLASIGPILALAGLREALTSATAPVLAVSPIVNGQVLKGPTAAFLRYAGLPISAQGVCDCYRGLLDGVVADEPVSGLPLLRTDTRMDDRAARRRLAQQTLDFAASLSASGLR